MAFFVLIILLLMNNLLFWEVNAKIYTLPSQGSNLTEQVFLDKQADFGGDIPDLGIVGFLDVAKPLNACKTVEPVKDIFKSYNVFALVEESKDHSSCPFDIQVLNCEKAGYHAVIVYNNLNDGQLKIMLGSGPKIPAFYVTHFAGKNLKKYILPLSSIQIIPEFELPLKLYLVPFAVVVGVCFLFMIMFSLFRFLRYRLRQKRSRLSPANLKKIPTKKFKKGDDYDVCAICLDEYEDGDKIRILPCNHAYHCKCVDPWLTSGKKLCPVCKQPVEPKNVSRTNSPSVVSNDNSFGYGEQSIDEGTENEENESDERTPLLSEQHYTPNVRNV